MLASGAAACDRVDEVHFVGAVGRAIGAENVVKPHCGLMIHVRMLPGIPRQSGLRFTFDEPPVDRGDVVFLRDGQSALKRRAVRARR